MKITENKINLPANFNQTSFFNSREMFGFHSSFHNSEPSLNHTHRQSNRQINIILNEFIDAIPDVVFRRN